MIEIIHFENFKIVIKMDSKQKWNFQRKYWGLCSARRLVMQSILYIYRTYLCSCFLQRWDEQALSTEINILCNSSCDFKIFEFQEGDGHRPQEPPPFL